MFSGRSTQDNAGNISSLEEELEILSTSLAGDHVNFKAFWEQVKQLNFAIRNATTISREQRDALRARLDNICADAKQRLKDAAVARERRQVISSNKRSLVEMKIREARGYAKAGRDADDLQKARTLLQEAREWMKDGWAGFNATTQLTAFDDGRMTGFDRRTCNELWQEVNDMLAERRRELGDYNFSIFESEAEHAIGTAEYDPKQTREQVQSIQRRMKGKIMSGEQFERIRYLLDKAWSLADNESNKRRHEAIRRKKELIGKVMNDIQAIEDQIDHYRGEEANARTDNFAEAMREKIEVRYGWIEEKKSFIRELEEQIHDIYTQLKH